RGLTSDVLTTAALGVVGALRAPASRPPAPSASAFVGAAVNPWAHEGRARLQFQRRWVDANHHRTGR
ncbi:MAG: hypothetical protein ACREDE_02565, partial [Thermoplasmata archaeon]